MEEIKIGDYIRTNKGYITQVIAFERHYTAGRRLGIKEKVTENYLNLGRNQVDIIESISYTIPPCHPSDEELEVIKKAIVKHSSNIIDLIEVGDYVNGKRVIGTQNRINDDGEKVIITENYDEWTDDGVLTNKQIKSIVTKEMMTSVEYRLED